MSAPATTTPPKASDAMLEKVTEYTPFGAADPIQLSIAVVRKWICKPTKSGAVATDSDCLRFIALCKARQLNPWEGDAYLVGYDSERDGPTFSLITAHQAFLKRAEAHPQFDGMDSGVIVADKAGGMIDREGDFQCLGDTLLGAWATVYRKDRTRPTKRRINLATFNKGYSRWKSDPAGMIVKCAEADGLRSTFPNNIAGMFLREEFEDAAPAMADRMMGRLAATEAGNGQTKQLAAPAEYVPIEQAPSVPITSTTDGTGKTEPKRGPGRPKKQPETAPVAANEAADGGQGQGQEAPPADYHGGTRGVPQTENKKLPQGGSGTSKGLASEPAATGTAGPATVDMKPRLDRIRELLAELGYSLQWLEGDCHAKGIDLAHPTPEQADQVIAMLEKEIADQQ